MRPEHHTCSRGWKVPGTAWVDGSPGARIGPRSQHIRVQQVPALLRLQLASNFRKKASQEREERA